MTPEGLAEALIIDHLDDGIESLSAHESDEAQGMDYYAIEQAIDIANTHLRWLSTRVNL